MVTIAACKLEKKERDEIQVFTHTVNWKQSLSFYLGTSQPTSCYKNKYSNTWGEKERTGLFWGEGHGRIPRKKIPSKFYLLPSKCPPFSEVTNEEHNPSSQQRRDGRKQVRLEAAAGSCEGSSGWPTSTCPVRGCPPWQAERHGAGRRAPWQPCRWQASGSSGRAASPQA